MVLVSQTFDKMWLKVIQGRWAMNVAFDLGHILQDPPWLLPHTNKLVLRKHKAPVSLQHWE